MICTKAFCGCSSLIEVELPDGIEEIGIDAFCGTGLESLVMPSSVRIIHQGAFCDCPNLEEVVLNEGLEALGTDEYPDDGRMCHGVFDGVFGGVF